MLELIPKHLYSRFPVSVEGPEWLDDDEILFHVYRVCDVCKTRMRLDIKFKLDLPARCRFYLDLIDELVVSFMLAHSCGLNHDF